MRCAPISSVDKTLGQPSLDFFAGRPRLSGAPAGVTLRVVSLLDRITIDAEVCHGAPTVRGLRYPVEMIVGLLASGMTTDEVLADYPDLEADDVLASLEYAALITRTRSSVPITAA